MAFFAFSDHLTFHLSSEGEGDEDIEEEGEHGSQQVEEDDEDEYQDGACCNDDEFVSRICFACCLRVHLKHVLFL